MIPVTIIVRELDFQKKICDRVHDEVEKATGVTINYLYGTMIEIPRAALLANFMAKTAQFFSFGTNDLTQMTFGFSRDDIGAFMNDYLENKLLDADPFQTIDVESVGKLLEIGVQGGRSTNPKLKVGICGEHGVPSHVLLRHRLQSKPRGNNTSSYSKPVRFGPAFFVTLFGITHIYRIFVIFKYPKCR